MLALGVSILDKYPTVARELSERRTGGGYMFYVKMFMRAVWMLSDLACDFPYARRVTKEFSAIIEVVRRINDEWDLVAKERTPFEEDTFATKLIPLDITAKFPYQEPSPSLQNGGERTGGSRSGVLWLF
jgi:hypothetical protein